jgi:hypothetical protein
MTFTLDTIVAAAILALLVIGLAGVLILIERTHRRAAQLPPIPWGADLTGDRDVVRTVRDLAVARDARASRAAGPQDRPAAGIPRRFRRGLLV